MADIETVTVDGLGLANTLRDEMKTEIEVLLAAGHRAPHLTVVLVGDDPASKSYIKGKQRACARIGADSSEHILPSSTTEKELLDLLDRLNNDDGVDGILVQLPLPKHISPEAVAEAIDPAKDADALHPLNFGRLLLGKPFLLVRSKTLLHQLFDPDDVGIRQQKIVRPPRPRSHILDGSGVNVELLWRTTECVCNAGGVEREDVAVRVCHHEDVFPAHRRYAVLSAHRIRSF